MFEGKTAGIFKLLDEECRMPNPSFRSFMQKVITNHVNCISFSVTSSRKTAPDFVDGSGFAIRHFDQEVYYNTVNNSEFQCLLQ